MATQTDAAHTKYHTTPDGTKYGYIYYPPQAGKETFLLLHGFPSGTWDWRHLIALLAPEGVGIIAPDLLGYGDTDKPHEVEAYRLRRMVDHVASICEAEGAKKVNGIGHDWGSTLLSDMWVWKPELFNKLIYISVGYIPPGFLDIDGLNKATKEDLGYETFGYWEFFNSEDGPSVIEKHHESFQHLCFVKDPNVWKHAMGPTGQIRKHLEADTGKDYPSLLNEADLKAHAQILLKGGYRGPTNWYKQALRGCNDKDYASMKEGQDVVTVPLLFIATTLDAICVPKYMEAAMQGKVKDLKVESVEASHWGIIEKPKEIFDHIKAFAKF